MSDFDDRGYLGQSAEAGIERVRAQKAEWFALAADVDKAMMRLSRAVRNSPRAGKPPHKHAAAILLRSCGNFQGIMLLAQRRMYAESCLLLRSLVENSFGIAALAENSKEYLSQLDADHAESKRRRGDFIVKNDMKPTTVSEAEFQQVLQSMQKGRLASPRAIAELGGLKLQYLLYAHLSDQGCHLTLSSITRHFNGHSISWSPATSDDNEFIIRSSIHATLTVGIVTTNLFGKPRLNADLMKLTERLVLLRPATALKSAEQA